MKKALNILKIISVYFVIIFAIFMMVFTIISVTTLDKVDRGFLGYKAFIVLSDSMSKTDFKAGDLVIIKDVDPNTLEVGDIISYRTSENSYEVVTHKIKEKMTDKNGLLAFVTYGTTTGTEDEDVVTYGDILGKYKFSIKGLGTFLQFFKSPPGYILCVFAPFFLIILIQSIRSVMLFKKYKKTICEEMEKDKRKLENEKIETEIIKQKLIASEEKAKIFEKELEDLKKELLKNKTNTKKETTKKQVAKKNNEKIKKMAETETTTESKAKKTSTVKKSSTKVKTVKTRKTAKKE